MTFKKYVSYTVLFIIFIFLYYTSKTAFIHPSFSGLFVTCAYFPHTTLPDCVTRPNSDTFTSKIVPLVITPNSVYNDEDGFFFTPIISK
jgi:hypothetical protein